jgi:DNA-binding GntR family transcriptional regulator
MAALIADGHQKIYDAVAARDVTRAATAINEHFEQARARIRR